MYELYIITNEVAEIGHQEIIFPVYRLYNMQQPEMSLTNKEIIGHRYAKAFSDYTGLLKPYRNTRHP